jgi:aconitate hydratase
LGLNLARKILTEHLVSGDLLPGREIAIRIDQAFTHDLAVMAWQQFESMGLSRVRTELAVDYTDHNTLQTDYRNADDHRYLQSAAAPCISPCPGSWG